MPIPNQGRDCFVWWWPKQLRPLTKANGIIIVPGLKRAGFVIGGEYGKGVFVARLPNGRWSAPSTIRRASWLSFKMKPDRSGGSRYSRRRICTGAIA